MVATFISARETLASVDLHDTSHTRGATNRNCSVIVFERLDSGLPAPQLVLQSEDRTVHKMIQVSMYADMYTLHPYQHQSGMQLARKGDQ